MKHEVVAKDVAQMEKKAVEVRQSKRIGQKTEEYGDQIQFSHSESSQGGRHS